MRHTQASVYADPRFVQPNRHAYPPIPTFAPSASRPPGIGVPPNKSSSTSYVTDRLIHLFVPSEEPHRVFAEHPSHLTSSRRLTSQKQIVYSDGELRAMDMMIKDMQDCLQRQKALSSSLLDKDGKATMQSDIEQQQQPPKPTLKVDSETIKAQLKGTFLDF